MQFEPYGALCSQSTRFIIGFPPNDYNKDGHHLCPRTDGHPDPDVVKKENTGPFSTVDCNATFVFAKFGGWFRIIKRAGAKKSIGWEKELWPNVGFIIFSCLTSKCFIYPIAKTESE